MSVGNSKIRTTEQPSRAAKHLAAHAVLAFRTEFRVESVSLSATSSQGGIICHWKQARAAYANDTKLVNRSFALAYIEDIIDQEELDRLPDDSREEIQATR